MSDDLSLRAGLPDAFRYLEAGCARAAWPELALHPTARHWLQIHDMFRGIVQDLDVLGGQWREGAIGAPAYRAGTMPRLRHLLGNLEAHHHHESANYFPALAAAEPGMRAGFELLDRDHDAIHALLLGTAEAAMSFNRTPDDRAAADALALAGERLARPLRRHLLDEEEIIVPVLTLRGDPLQDG